MVSFEQLYYENDHLWDPTRVAPHDWDRIDQVLSALAPDAESLLDVGCGNGICCNQARQQRPRLKRVVGFDRSLSALKYVETEKCAGDIHQLPFGDQEFDASVSLEVLEHLPLSIFEAAVREIARVTRTQIIITVPNSEKLQRNAAQCPKCKTRFSRTCHMRSFRPSDMQQHFAAHHFVCREVRPLSVLDYYGLSKLVTLSNRLRGRHLALGCAVCPLCGFHTPNARPNDKRPLQRHPHLKRFTKKVWPKKKFDRWLMASYERVDGAAARAA
jgi:SAM-dependent methyltransferase